MWSDGPKMHDAIAERARQHLSGPTRPWRAPGTHVEAGGSSPGGHVGGAVSHSVFSYAETKHLGGIMSPRWGWPTPHSAYSC
jgi:hypothetical protein